MYAFVIKLLKHVKIKKNPQPKSEKRQFVKPTTNTLLSSNNFARAPIPRNTINFREKSFKKPKKKFKNDHHDDNNCLKISGFLFNSL